MDMVDFRNDKSLADILRETAKDMTPWMLGEGDMPALNCALPAHLNAAAAIVDEQYSPHVRRLVAAVSAFLADEDELMEAMLAEGLRVEDFGMPFPRVIEMRSAVAAFPPPPKEGE